ncbi:hypothetical protein PABG_00894 [Paracoccidioides brasiliensis Pb03]|nr:hypothetical protein PABG_00894 [Paracoccidioides brasiliensis Pb03]
MASPVHYHYCGHNRQQTSPSVFWDWDRSDGDTRGARISFINRNEGVTRGFRNSLHVKPTDSGKKPNFEAFSGFHTSVEEEEPGTEIFSTKWGPLSGGSLWNVHWEGLSEAAQEVFSGVPEGLPYPYQSAFLSSALYAFGFLIAHTNVHLLNDFKPALSQHFATCMIRCLANGVNLLRVSIPIPGACAIRSLTTTRYNTPPPRVSSIDLNGVLG